jgi:membrane-associated phospholipid phosphatase
MKFKNEIFITLTGAALLAASVFSLVQTQMNISLGLNQFHNKLFDYLCYFGTHAGDGLFAITLGVILLFTRFHSGILVLLAYAFSSGLTQILKRLVFDDVHRPLWHLEKLSGVIYYIPQGAEHIYNNSFPSGHTTTAFAVFSVLSFITENKVYKGLYFVAAIFVAFSRVYLLQHFMVDTMAGASIGLLFSILIYFHLYQKSHLNFLLNLKPKK